ncbi:MAG: glycosyltransferase [Dysgonomonas sp.]|nr:glycosyltransferase [Dysgonomonas sp.]
MKISKRIVALFRWRKIKISYGITVCNEAEELKRLLDCLVPNVSHKDEIIILSDKSKVTNEVLDVINKYISDSKLISHISYPLNNDFATYKNNLIDAATGNYLFQIDADEVPNIQLIKSIRYIVNYYSKFDSFRIPRINIVEGVTEEHIQNWGWNIDDKGRVNFPDLQMRLFCLNKGILWKNKVHEELINYSSVKVLSYETEENCLYHIKNIDRQVAQNDYYETLN